MRSFFLTTPIYYVNDKPHIGHAYTNIISDIITRTMNLAGLETYLLTGTDEHGAKIESAAHNKQISVQLLVDQNSEHFKKLLKLLNVKYNHFVRTTDKDHKEIALGLWNKLYNSGNLYLGKYKGWYVKKDEAFYTEKELKNLGMSITDPNVEWLEEESYFFKLSSWQEKLLEFYDKNPNFIIPIKYRNEVINFVRSGLEDLSVSRKNISWGIKVPNSDHIIYVWLDALSSYFVPFKNLEYLWPCDLHIIGKDILKFHAIFWPAFLMATNIEPPKSILVHGWWKNEGQKISKSLGNIIDPNLLIKQFGVDVIRYILIRMLNIGNDGNFTQKIACSINNSELVNKIGNLVHRSSYFLQANMEGLVPNLSNLEIDNLYKNGKLLSKLDHNVKQYKNIIDSKTFELNKMLDIILNITEEANIFFEQRQVWKKKDNPKEMAEILYQTLETIRYIAIMLQPFMPESAHKILDQIGSNENKRSFLHLDKNFKLECNKKISDPKVIFNKML